ncbi:16S rRNA (uracil(1498)-N(3))-methyltransferase [Micropruina sp.]|uniref:16S rRNA (uracil(1498)-N(3))-methyltransferase n=1 Tax=Micropruina sp. TaxID=2737536 RepID=UPI00262C3212|nr:16S rRNA (uracil(1498)-N(3))-methyltransferase [Micropruina sp.]
MTEALFLADLDSPAVGDTVAVTGDEGRHAAIVRRIRKGEIVLVSDGIGNAIKGPVLTADVNGLTVEVAEVLTDPARPLRFTVVQALAKGDRTELALEMLTELGVDEIVPWQASRSVVRWAPDRVERALARWRNIVREATKQSRRFRVPRVSPPLTTPELALRVAEPALTLVLHEGADVWPSVADLPAEGEVMVIIGPEGGLTPEELELFAEAGGRPTLIADAVLRTSTAGVVALAQLQALTRA